MAGLSFMRTFSRRLATIVAVTLVVSLIMFIQLTNFENYFAKPKSWTMKKFDFHLKGKNDKEVSTNQGDKNYIWEQIQLERIKSFREKCQIYKLYATNSSNIDLNKNILYSEKYKLAYRPIPKVGSTFMKQVFLLLSGIKSEQVFDIARHDVHKSDITEIVKPITFENLNGYTVLIISRNPYSRIYSAYIDKVYIVNSLPMCKHIHSTVFIRNNKTRSCKLNISFEDFLDYILFTNKTVIRSHYAPVMSLSYCKKVCSLKDIQIVKQETFSEDINYVLKSVNVKGKVYDVIYDMMNSKRTQTTVRSIVMTVYQKHSTYIERKSCLTWKDMAIKLWESFQIQGYIHKNSKFPETKFDNKSDYESLIDVIMKEKEKIPLNHEEQVRQRNEALVKAYASVGKKYIREIYKRYSRDFELFQYKKDIKLSVN